jgi:hypothetical protein
VFASGRSIRELCLEAILVRRALRKYDSWKAVERIWKQNRGSGQRKYNQTSLRTLRSMLFILAPSLPINEEIREFVSALKP